MSAHQNGEASRFPRPPRRTIVPNLSFTRPPSVETDQDIRAKAWCNVPVDQLDLDLFDENGFPINQGGR